MIYVALHVSIQQNFPTSVSISESRISPRCSPSLVVLLIRRYISRKELDSISFTLLANDQPKDPLGF